MGEKRYVTKGFYGTVILKDWTEGPDGDQYKGFTGLVSILKDEEIVGFKSEGNNNANWVARVEGPTTSVTILGCQIRGAWTHEPGTSRIRNWLVLA
jgi:hypothetical protein